MQEADPREYPETEFDLDALAAAVKYQQWVTSVVLNEPRDRVLEVGAGTGNMTRWLAGRAGNLIALEPERKLCERIESLNLANVQVVHGTLDSLAASPSSFDAAVMVNVLEHIEDDTATLRAINEVLKSGSELSVFVPAHPWLFGSLDTAYGHVRRYTKSGLKDTLEGAGFYVNRIRYFNPIGALGWFWLGKVAKRPGLSPSSVKAAERWIIPLARKLDRLGAPPFGQSLVAVAAKRPDDAGNTAGSRKGGRHWHV